jgi:hypothetical protein
MGGSEIMAKEIITKIEYCIDCPHFRVLSDDYKRSDEDCRVALICDKSKTLLMYRNSTDSYCKAETVIPENCPL